MRKTEANVAAMTVFALVILLWWMLVIAGMTIIGLIGLSLDASMRLLEKSTWVRWRYAH